MESIVSVVRQCFIFYLTGTFIVGIFEKKKSGFRRFFFWVGGGNRFSRLLN